jgi:hypothetical protein
MQIWSPLELEVMAELQGDLELELRYVAVAPTSLLASGPRRSAPRSLRELIGRFRLFKLSGTRGSRSLVKSRDARP